MVWKATLAAFMVAQAQPESTLPNFQFRGAIAGEQQDLKGFGPCSKEPNDVKVCRMDTGEVAGVRTGLTVARTYQRRLTMLGGLFSSDNFDTVAASFAEKYGTPCDFQTVEVINGLGARLPSQVITWCFRSGKLVLKKRAIRIGTATFEYTDQWQPPADPPKVDF